MQHLLRLSVMALLALVWLACCPPARPAPYDMVEMTVASAPGVGTITFGTALTPYRSLSATGAVTGELLPYHIADGANWENGRGIVNFGANITLTRGPVTSSIGGGAINASSSAIVWLPLLAEDAVTTVYPSSVLTQVTQPICPLTDAATILSDVLTCANDPTKGVGINSVTLTTARKLGLPGHLTPSGGQYITYMITHSGSADGPALTAGFRYPGSGQPPECNGTNITTGCWSTGTQTDLLPCFTVDASHVDCAPILTNMVDVPAITAITQFTSATTFPAATANALIGAVSVTMSSGAFTGQLRIIGANTCGIVLTSAALPSNAQAPAGGVSASAGPHGNGLCDDWTIEASAANVFDQAEAATATAPPYAFPNVAGGTTNCGPTAVTTCASDTMNITNGNTLFVVAVWNPSGTINVTSIAKTAGAPGGTGTIGTCVVPQGGNPSDSFGHPYFYLVRCPITGTGTIQMTATMSAAAQYIQMPMFQMTGLAASPDAGIGNAGSGFNSGPLTVATNGVTPQTNDFVLSIGAVNAGTIAITPSPGFTALINNSNLGSNTIGALIEWKQDLNSGDAPSNSMAINSSADWVAGIQVLKHP